MNYYKRHIGDYMKDASHLSLLEHGVYMRLLDVYYTREGAIPAAQAARLIGARSADEKEALEVVAGEFFTLVDGNYVQARCDREIASMLNKAETNRVVGARGGRPRKATHQDTQPASSGNPDQTQDEPRKNPEITQTVSGKNPEQTQATSHKPLANNQYPPYPLAGSEGVEPAGSEGAVFPALDDSDDLEATEPATAQVDGLPPSVGSACTTAGAVCLTLKVAGIPDVSPGNPKLLALLAAGADLAEFLDAGKRAVKAGKGFAYALAIVENERRRAAQMAAQLHAGAMPAQASKTSFAQAQADIARTTVPGREGRDPTLERIEADAARAAPMPPEVRAKLAALRGAA